MKASNYLIAIFLVSILISTSGCGTGNSNTEAEPENNTKEEIQEEIIPEKIYQDEEAKNSISLAINNLKSARESFMVIKDEQKTIFTLLTIYENKIDIANCRQDMSSIDYSSFRGYSSTIGNNINKLDKIIQEYNRSIHYFNEAEKLDISPEYKEYLAKYKEAIIKERDSVFQYQLVTVDKSNLLSIKGIILSYIYTIDEATANYRVAGITMNEREARNYNDLIRKASGIIGRSSFPLVPSLKSLEHDSSGLFQIEYNREEKRNEVIYPKVGPRKSGSQVNREILIWEKETTNNMILSEKYFNEAIILVDDAEKILPK